jgi:TetR/AcrR family transcriptional regulator, transcriptional repressor for nem operon
MRYSPEHKENTRARLLEVGGALAKKDGFGTTGVDSLMAAVGLTSGAFYSHFSTKTKLLEAIVENELTRSVNLFADKTDAQVIAALESYLSISHVNNPAEGCAVTSLSAEVARSNIETKQTFERMMLQLKTVVQSHTVDENAAWAMIAQLVGAVMIARAMATEDPRKSLLEAVMQHAREMVVSAKMI